MYHACVFGSSRYRQRYSRPLIKSNIFELTQFWNKFPLESVSFSVGKIPQEFIFPEYLEMSTSVICFCFYKSLSKKYRIFRYIKRT